MQFSSTGCSISSIGFRAAQILASEQGFRVVLACRDEEKGRAALAQLNLECPGASAALLPLDLASLASVRAFVERLFELDGGAVQKQGLSLLVNNAGVGWGRNTPYRTTEVGQATRACFDRLETH